MKLGYRFYKVERKDAHDAIEKYYKDKGKVFARLRKLAKRTGCKPDRAFCHESPVFMIGGLSFDKPPKDTQNYLSDTSRGYIPKKTSPYWEDFKNLGTVDMAKVEEAIGWKNIFDDRYFYTFNPFYFPKGKYLGFRAPVFSDKKLNYKPVSGVKEITIDEYYALAQGKEINGRRAGGKKVPTPKRGSSGSSKGRRNGGVHTRVPVRSSKVQRQAGRT